MYTKRVNGFDMESKFFEYMLDHASEGLRTQLKETSRTRFSLIKFLDKSKCDFASHFGNLMDLDLEKLDGVKGESFIPITDNGFYDICRDAYADSVKSLVRPLIQPGEKV